MIKRKFHTAKERPDLVPTQEDRPRHHEPATCWAELTQENKALFQKAAAILQEKYPEAKLFAFGSRVNGNWSEESDLDIVCQAEEFKREKVPVTETINADCFPFVPSNLLIEIPCQKKSQQSKHQ